VNNRFSGSMRVRECICRENYFPRAIRGLDCELRRILALFGRAVMLASALTLVVPIAASAQNNAVPARVTDRIDDSRLVTLSGHTHPLARAQYDQGAAPPDLPMNRIMLVLKRSANQESALQDLLVQQQVTSSTNFHKWLTPDQFGQQFGPADADIQAVTSWLASYGFQSIKVSKGRTVIEFSGTASQVQTALHTPIHRYTVNGESHWANANEPQIPVALAPVISGFASLHNFPKKPASVRSGRTAALTRTPNGNPQINFQGGSHGVAPADFNTIYSVTPSGMTGSGVTIGIIARSNINPQDVTDFRNTFKLGGSGPNIILNGPDPGDLGGGEEAEATLDATWTGAVAPAATVDLVVSEPTNAAQGEDLSEFYIIDNNLADVMTESFSVCEASFGSSLLGSTGAAQFYSSMAEQAAAQGITYLVASGDSGPDSCDDPSTVPTKLSAASVNLLASTPFTVAVGGTEFNDTASPSTYWNSTSAPTTLGSAKSYIPENVWNESCTVAQCGSSLTGLWSSGGGQSIVFPQPVWQSGVTGIPAGNRSVPDVSLAAADHDGYVLCLDASCQATNTTCTGGVGPCFSILSGTSASAQAFGGIMALVVQKIGARVGIANYALYKLAAAETLSSCNASNVPPALPPANTCIFNDVTVGDTNIPEVNPGPPSNQETGFKAGVGYDEATGLGSVNVTNLVNQWNTAIVNSTTTTLTLNSGTAINITHGKAVPVNITVTPAGAATVMPTGDVSLVANSNTDAGVDGFMLTPGTTNSSVISSTSLLPGGIAYQVHAHYEGDGTFLGSDSTPPVTVTVTPEASRTSLGIVVTKGSSCTTTTSVAYGSPYILTVVVADLNAGSTACAPNETGSSPTGTLTVTDSFNGGAATPLDGGSFKLNSFGEFEDQKIQLPVGTHNIQAAYPGDNSFAASATNAPTVTVSKALTTSAATPSSTSVAANTVFSLTVLVDTQTSSSPAVGSTGAAPAGTVTFSATTTASVLSPGQRNWPEPNRFLVGEVCAALACLFTMLFATKRRRGAVLLGMTMVIVIAAGSSCGSTGATSSTTTTTLGTANLSATTDANGFAAATATLNTAKLATTGTITATYSGDGNYNSSTSPVVTVTVH
jgi:Pro-kumamolisin, activation domain/Bacterial Ig-like domain (group 3)